MDGMNYLLAVLSAAAVAPVLVLLVRTLVLPRRRVRSGTKSLRIAFVHPDLGIGGAERLVVDAAVALQEYGHSIMVYTARHEPHHCFEETRDGTLKVVVMGDFLPKRILGRFYAACAYIRMCWISWRIALASLWDPFDVLFVDQVSICIPLLMLARSCGIIFYCHYPDYLLTGRTTLLKRLYRAPLDCLEERTTGLADVIFVNSRFTAGVFAEAFPVLKQYGICPDVLYPALNLSDQDKVMGEVTTIPEFVKNGEQILLSINRFEEKKNIGLAIRAFASLPKPTRSRVHLVIAGGYDEKLPENVRHAAALDELAKELGVADRVTQLRSISAQRKAQLLKHASALLYTPDKEHFGIVPVEAMYASVPVIAVNSGGPLESIVEAETGYLRPADPPQWASVITNVLEDATLREKLGTNGKMRVQNKFSLAVFGRTLDTTVRRVAEGTHCHSD